MTQELKDKALDILNRCTIDGQKVILPDEEIDTQVWTIVKDALVQAGAQYNKKTKLFVFEIDPQTGINNGIHWLNLQETIEYDVPTLYSGPEEVEAEEEETDEKKMDPGNMKTEKRTLKYVFTATEIHELAQQLGRSGSDLNSLKEEKASIASQYASRIKEKEATFNKLSLLISNGYDIREVECDIVYNQPEPGKKTIIRKDTNTATVEKMDPWEFNLFNQPAEEDVFTT